MDMTEGEAFWQGNYLNHSTVKKSFEIIPLQSKSEGVDGIFEGELNWIEQNKSSNEKKGLCSQWVDFFRCSDNLEYF